ncbi:LOW QUALITY PROTEIN: hypothetical protein U9M48_003266 [Paspalum notatum var. saurae]|uniref:Uncharacterized protein n=1 Tax=Paspalum notatum var. saurae TaxID=547442 RepID=A0AAQ3PIT7_PASNO
MFPDEVPLELPPKRGIEHQIDLVSSASLSNRPPDRTDQEETRAIQHQVQELINKGYVRESVSPCVVLVLFVPKKDDILIYHKSLNELVEHIKCVLVVLGEESLYANLAKCTFCTNKVVILGLLLQEKVWRCVTNQSCSRLFTSTKCEPSFYHQFVKDLSTIAALINELTKKYMPFHWGEPQAKAFEELKMMFTTSPFLALPDFGKIFKI